MEGMSKRSGRYIVAWMIRSTVRGDYFAGAPHFWVDELTFAKRLKRTEADALVSSMGWNGRVRVVPLVRKLSAMEERAAVVAWLHDLDMSRDARAQSAAAYVIDAGINHVPRPT